MSLKQIFKNKNSYIQMNRFNTIFFTGLFLIVTMAATAQSGYVITKDSSNGGGDILSGILTKQLLQTDANFKKWYNPSQNQYAPDSNIVKAFKKAATQKLQFVVFGGTWCEDTQFIIPRFFKLQEMGAVPDNHISFYGVNRSKKTLGNIADAFGIINVPTIIIMKDGKEAGRVVEYGKTGKWDMELGEIINNL